MLLTLPLPPGVRGGREVRGPRRRDASPETVRASEARPALSGWSSFTDGDGLREPLPESGLTSAGEMGERMRAEEAGLPARGDGA